MPLSFNNNGLKLSYPESLTIKGDFVSRDPGVNLADYKAEKAMAIILYYNTDFGMLYDIKCNPATFSRSNTEIIKAGSNPLFTGSKELIVKYKSPTYYYNWSIIIPFGVATIFISARSNSEEELYNFWLPIIKSIEFNPSQFPPPHRNELVLNKLSPGETVSYYFSIPFGYLAVYDSKVQFLPEEDFDDIDLSIRIIKVEQCFSLYPVHGIGMYVNFRLTCSRPEEDGNNWDHIIEGILGTYSGKLYADDESPKVELSIPKGTYKFRAYFSAVGPDDSSGNINVYFWPTADSETNFVRVIKQSNYF